MLTNAIPAPANPVPKQESPPAQGQEQSELPDDPGQEILPVAVPEPLPPSGVPVRWEARRQTRMGDLWTLEGEVVVHYRDYVIHADRVVYHQSTTELEAEGHVQVTGGPEDAVIEASHGDMRLDMHTARFFNVDGSVGVRPNGNAVVYTTTNPFLFSGRVLLQTGPGAYRIIDGKMTNCRLPRPDWQVISRSIRLEDGRASTANSFFRLFGVPLLYLPYLRHPVNESGRESGLLIPVLSNSSIKGYTFGEQFYIVLNRSMDMIVGADYYSKRGYAPNGDFRYRGPGSDNMTLHWNALLDRGVEATPPATGLVNQGGVEVIAFGHKDLTDRTWIVGNIDYLSSYVYRLVFAPEYTQAVNSDVVSVLALTHNQDGYVSSGFFGRLQTFAGSGPGQEARILHLPTLRFDALDRTLNGSAAYWGMSSSVSELSRAELNFHSHNVGRIDLHPHLSLPLVGDGWSIVPEVGLRETFYSGSQAPDVTGANGGVPVVSHDPLNRLALEGSVDIRPPALERDFTLTGWNRVLRHVIEPELYYRFVGGIGADANNVLLFDTEDIATNTSEAGYSLTQRLYLRPIADHPCSADETPGGCPDRPREWASWQIAQKYLLEPALGGAVLNNQRNVFDTTLDLTGVAFLTTPRNLSPVISRLRFEAIDNLRVEWDLDYDPRTARVGADNVYAGMTWGSTTVGLGHSMLNNVENQEVTGPTGAQSRQLTIVHSQQLQPFVEFGRPNRAGFSFAANGGYDFVNNALQYAGIQAVYNLNCCGFSAGYRRFQLGSVGTTSRDETEWLYSFTLANFGTVGDIHIANSVFRNRNLPPLY